MDITRATTTNAYVAVLIDAKCEQWRAEARESFDAIVRRAGGCVYCARGIPVTVRNGERGHEDLYLFASCARGGG